MRLLPLLQLLAAALWLVPTIQIAPSIRRIWRRAATRQDHARAPLIAAPLAGVAGSFHWLVVAPEVAARVHGFDLAFWTSVWALWCLGALGQAYALHATKGLGG